MRFQVQVGVHKTFSIIFKFPPLLCVCKSRYNVSLAKALQPTGHNPTSASLKERSTAIVLLSSNEETALLSPSSGLVASSEPLRTPAAVHHLAFAERQVAATRLLLALGPRAS
jgi:hypothetical protein